MTQLYYLGVHCFGVGVVVSKRPVHGSSHPTRPISVLARTPTASDETIYSLLLGRSGQKL